jgi:CheY-like chemotaxis protein
MPHRMLLADDSLTIQKVVELTFSDSGYELMAVGSGDKAVEALESFRPDIVLADVVMPGLSGYEVCERVKALDGGEFIPVILLTGTFEPFDRSRAERVGCDAIVTKPFDSHALASQVKDLLGKAAHSRAMQPGAFPVPAPAPTEEIRPPASAGTVAMPALSGWGAVLESVSSDKFGFETRPPSEPESQLLYATTALRIPSEKELFAMEAKSRTEALPVVPPEPFDAKAAEAAEVPETEPPVLLAESDEEEIAEEAYDEPYGDAGTVGAFPEDTAEADAFPSPEARAAAPDPIPSAEVAPLVVPLEEDRPIRTLSEEPAFLAPEEEPIPFREEAAPSPAIEMEFEETLVERPFHSELRPAHETTLPLPRMNEPIPAEPLAPITPAAALPEDSTGPIGIPTPSRDSVSALFESDEPPAPEPERVTEPGLAAADAGPFAGPEPMHHDLDEDVEAFERSDKPTPRANFWDELPTRRINATEREHLAEPPEPLAAPEVASEPIELEALAAGASLTDLIPPESSVKAQEPLSAPSSGPLSESDIDRIARRVVELLGEKIIREIAWDVVPEMAERFVRARIQELESEPE